MKPFFLVAVAWLWLAGCATRDAGKDDKLTALPFNVTGAPEAMPAFQQGLLLLHNFEYDDAAEAFREAQRIDSTFVMAYWGEAMTYNHPVWGDLDIEKARGTLARLGRTREERIAKAETPLEKDFVEALEILYGEGSKPDREVAHAARMKRMYEQYPQNHEAAAFYALSLLGTKRGWSNADSINTLGAQVAEGILKENPVHPGALHYLIHSDDHPDLARKALAAANDYATVASYAAHALHMPSHIYLALGQWDDVVKSNEVAWQAGVDRKERKQLDNDQLSYHTHLWLEYGYLQTGKYTAAKKLLERQVALTAELPSREARVHLVFMKGHYLMETGDWAASLAGIPVETKDLSFFVRAANRLVDGAKAFHTKDAAALDKVIAAMDDDYKRGVQRKLADENITICGVKAYADKAPSQGALDGAAVMVAELKGMAAWLRNDLKEAEKQFAAAAAGEDGYLIGPPDIFKPAHEVYAEFLLAVNKPEEAYKQFAIALQYAPNRITSLKGQLQAAQQTDHATEAEALGKTIDDILKNADARTKKSS